MTENDNPFEFLRILLVEDSFDALNLIRNMLIDLSVTQVFTAKNGIEAIELMGILEGDDGVDIILCDRNMPGMSGIEFLRKIRSRDPDVPFLMITGVADHDSVTEAMSLGVTGYIKKPFSADQLKNKLNLVSRILAHRGKASTAAS